ncbi:MAG TPA: hypothetical protein VLM44_03080, partial [Lutibacter sp.]|nr:hypothetical protein [Lutibacter sp.]
MGLRSSFWLLAVGFLLVSCSTKNKKHDENSVFRYNEHANITTLDPAFSKDLQTIWVTNQLFNGLVQLDDSLNVQPDIAHTWTISEDGKMYAFNLKKDIKFHKHILFGKDSTRSVVASDFE